MLEAASHQLPAAVVFDCDGVLIESVELKTEAFKQLFAGYPEHHEAITQHHLAHLGISRFEKFRWIYRELLHRELTEKDSEDLGKHFSELVARETRACSEVSGATETLSALYDQGIPLFVASGTPQAELVEVISGRGWHDRLAGVYGSPRTKPEILGSIASIVAAPPAHLTFVGDGESDYKAAREAGTIFVLRETAAQADRFRDFKGARIADLDGFAARLQEFSAPPAKTGR